MSKPENPAAFPNDHAKLGNTDRSNCESGMTLRDYFAAAALQGMLADETGPDGSGEWKPHSCAERAYKFADAMLIARSKS